MFEIFSTGKTSKWQIINNRSNSSLGIVKWYGPCRQYCFFPHDLELVFSAGCLNDIKDFITQLMNERKGIKGCAACDRGDFQLGHSDTCDKG